MLINRALRADQIVEQDDSDFEGFDLEAMTKRLRDIMALPHGADEAGRRERLQEIMKLDLSIDAYRQFLRDKVVMSKDLGFPIEPGEVNPILKPHQVDCVRWAIRGGRRAIFAAFGLGKTMMQLETLRLIQKRVDGWSLIVAPLGVRQEFVRDGIKLGIDVKFIRTVEEIHQADMEWDAGSCDGKPEQSRAPVVYLTNYETVRDGKLDPSLFAVTSLDEAAVLRSFGGTKTYREFMRLFETVKYRFVATATPDPNEYIEILSYSAYLGIMDVSAAKTRFFKRDSTHANNLTLHPHKEKEFWMWVASWALFLQKPSDLGHSDEGYDLPPMKVIYHEVPANYAKGAGQERDGQLKLLKDAIGGVTDAAREKRDSLPQRLRAMVDILDSQPLEHFLIWHDLEAERHAIESTVLNSTSVYGKQDEDEKEKAIIDFSEGRIPYLAAKPVMLGAGPNFQYHCSRAIFLGIGFKFNEFIQALKRIHRFLQSREVEIHLIHAESERRVLQNLMDKWQRYNERAEKMSDIIREYGLSQEAMIGTLTRTIGIERVEVSGEKYRCINNDCVEELQTLPENSIDLIVTSIPFSTQYEYTPSYNDFGHSESNRHFFEQMNFLSPHLLRVLQPGRIAAIHVKDRIVPGGITGLGFQTLYPFHADCIRHYTKHGFAFMGMKTIVTDVVRENNQTYRLGWTEQCKDGTKMGVGSPEYLLIFRKPPTDCINAYADNPVVKLKRKYTRSRWQIDAHAFSRSNGNRPPTPEELESLPHATIFKLFRDYSLNQIYDFEYHVKLGERLEEKGRLPVTFMLLQPQSNHPDVWTDVTRMRTLNGSQSAKGKVMHLAPLQFDICERAIAQYSMEGETVLDPFAGLMTVPYCAIKLGRKAIGIELSPSYFLDGCMYVEAAAREVKMPSMFDCLETEEDKLARDLHEQEHGEAVRTALAIDDEKWKRFETWSRSQQSKKNSRKEKKCVSQL